jgi:TIR domain
MATAFISHATEDREVAERICSFLEKRDIRCWIAPRDVRPGHRYGEEIVNAIQSANAVILILSESANASKFVEREIERAVSYGKPTLPVRVREVQPSRSLELFISDAHWIDAWKPPMEQYLDRLADSIRSLSPEGAGAEKANLPSALTPRQTPSSSGRRLAIGAVVLLIFGVAAGASWWFLNQSHAPVRIAMTPTPLASPTPNELVSTQEVSPTALPLPTASEKSSAAAATPPAQLTPPPALSPSPSPTPPVTPVETPVATAASSLAIEPSEALAEILAALGNSNGMTRYSALRNNANRLPSQISVDDLLALIGGTGRRSDAIEMLSSRLPSPTPVADLLRILGPTSGMERFGLIRLFAQRLPAKISVDQLLALINNASRRSDAIGLLARRLPSPLPVEDVLRILAPTSGMERYGLMRLFAPSLPAQISVDQLLALINNTSRRSDAIGVLLQRLPSPVSVEEILRVLGSTSGMERYGLVRLFAPRLPSELSVDQLLNLINNTNRRSDTIALLAGRLANPLPVKELFRILGSSSGMERYGLIKIIAPHAPRQLAAEEISALVQGSSRAPEAAKLLRH